MGIMNLGLFRKAYMLEFLENDIPKEVFTFSIPPEAEDFSFDQRVTETKTFGGSAFDDYGNDTIKITLSGSTVNEEKKIIYKGLTKPPKYLSGEKEIYHLQGILEEWGDIEKVSKKKVYLYDLSKMSLIQLAAIAGGGSPSRNYWRVAIKNLKIKRSKDKPRTYNYTLEMIGFMDEKNIPNPLFGGALEILETCQNVLDKIQEVTGYVEFAAAAADSVAKGIVDTKKAFEKIGKADWTNPIGIMKNTAKILDAPLRIISGDSSNSVFNTTQNLISATKKFASLGTSPEDKRQTGSSSNDQRAVSFNCMGGSYIAPKKVNYGNYLEPPPNPTLAKYAFAGWHTDQPLTIPFNFEETEISENITLYAKWTQAMATITFNSRQGTFVDPQSVAIGQVIALPDPPTRNGYVFEYWCTDIAAENRYEFTTLVTSDITLYARWRTVYMVIFNSNGGSAIPNQQIEVSGMAIYPIIPERNNYLFVCWCSNVALTAEYDFSTIVSSSLTLYAKWTQVSNTASFNSNGGSAVPSQTVRIGQYVTRPYNPVRDGYTFVRWCSDTALTNEFLFETTAVNLPVTIYAAWSINIFTVTFESNGGSNIPDQDNIQYMKKAVYPVNPTKTGYLFQRWCIDEELTTEFDFSTEITESITLYADWFGGSQ
jgi:uncharacterized repeat protein (TIGR02543 family)